MNSSLSSFLSLSLLSPFLSLSLSLSFSLEHIRTHPHTTHSKANIPGYTGHTHWARFHPSHTDVPPSSLPTSARVHRYIILYILLGSATLVVCVCVWRGRVVFCVEGEVHCVCVCVCVCSVDFVCMGLHYLVCVCVCV